MARAKQTARSEARRRNRLANRLSDEAMPNELDGEEGTEAGSGAAPAPGRPGSSAVRGAAGSRTATPARPGVLSAFRSAYHPAHIREDLADLPALLQTKAFLGGVGLMLAGTVIFVAVPTQSLAAILFQYVVYPPAFAPIFVIGFFAVRASYLLGFIFGLLDSVIFLLLLGSGKLDILYGKPFDPNLLPSAALSALVAGVGTGTIFAAAFAWYRRFLSLSSPRRAAQTKAGGRGTAKAKSSSRR